MGLTYQRSLMYCVRMATNTLTNPKERARALKQLQAMAEETRFSIVQLLASGERCVCELQSELGAAQSRLSFHLKKLKEAGVLADRKVGRWVYYRLDPQALEGLSQLMGSLCCQVQETPEGPWSPPSEPCC